MNALFLLAIMMLIAALITAITLWAPMLAAVETATGLMEMDSAAMVGFGNLDSI